MDGCDTEWRSLQQSLRRTGSVEKSGRRMDQENRKAGEPELHRRWSCFPDFRIDQTQAAYFWSDFSGTVPPPGHWTQIALALAASNRLDLPAEVRLFALVQVA